ncbi:MAG: hypothetical protein ABFR05_08890 [Bacteroidota bacterium]
MPKKINLNDSQFHLQNRLSILTKNVDKFYIDELDRVLRDELNGKMIPSKENSKSLILLEKVDSYYKKPLQKSRF